MLCYNEITDYITLRLLALAGGMCCKPSYADAVIMVRSSYP